MSTEYPGGDRIEFDCQIVIIDMITREWLIRIALVRSMPRQSIDCKVVALHPPPKQSQEAQVFQVVDDLGVVVGHRSPHF